MALHHDVLGQPRSSLSQVMVPDGAFYVFPNWETLLGRKSPSGGTIATDLDLCMHFLEDGALLSSPALRSTFPPLVCCLGCDSSKG